METLGWYVAQPHVNFVVVIGSEEVCTDGKHVEDDQECPGNNTHPIFAKPSPYQLAITQLSYFDCSLYFLDSLDCLRGSALYLIHNESSDLPKRGLCLRPNYR